MLIVSLSDPREVLLEGFKLLPNKLSLETYRFIYSYSGENILNAYGITFTVTVLGTLFAMLLTSMMAYTLSQKKVKYRNIIAFLCYFTVIFPAGLVPWYIVCVKLLHIDNTLLALILPAAINVWNMFLLRNYFMSIPDTVIESASIDGANDFTIFTRIMLPMSKNAVLTVSLFFTLQFWNDWYLAIMLITEKELFPMQYYLFSILTSADALSSGQITDSSIVQVPSLTVKMATTIITIFPVLFVFPFVQKHFTSGIMIGSVKG